MIGEKAKITFDGKEHEAEIAGLVWYGEWLVVILIDEVIHTILPKQIEADPFWVSAMANEIAPRIRMHGRHALMCGYYMKGGEKTTLITQSGRFHLCKEAF